MATIELSQKDVQGHTVYYRAGSSDERVINEVIVSRTYRRPTLNFDVEAGETWLDLGANIGTFAVYCQIRKATATCYEPDPDCFSILEKNVPIFELWNTAVTNLQASTIPFWKGRAPTDHYRGTAFPTKGLPSVGNLQNRYGDFLQSQSFDGVKMDIEGSEAGLLDDALFPKCEKFVMEYHLSRDPSTANLERRLQFLHSRFKTVKYPPEFDRFIAQGGEAKSFFDRLVFCKGAK